MDLQKSCVYCNVSKTLDQFCTLPSGVTSRCITCLDKLCAGCQVKAAAQHQATIQTLMTLNDFYLDLKAAKDEEPHTHTIPFNSKEASEGMRTFRIAPLGNNNLLDLDPRTKEGLDAFQVVAERIVCQCREILGYRWRYVMIRHCSAKRQANNSLDIMTLCTDRG